MVTSIWLGPCNGFGDFQGPPWDAKALTDERILDPQDPLWGKGVDNERRKGMIARDLTSPWPMARRIEAAGELFQVNIGKHNDNL